MRAFVAAVAAVAVALPAAAAEPDMQVQVTLLGGNFAVGSGPFFPAPNIGVALGFESGSDLYLLGLNASWGRFEQVVGRLAPDGSIAPLESRITHSAGGTLSPGYRRYLTGFENGFAPFLQGDVQFGLSWESPDPWGGQSQSSASTLMFALSGSFGAEVRVHTNLAITAQLIAGGAVMHRGGSLSSDTQSIGLSSRAGLTVRF